MPKAHANEVPRTDDSPPDPPDGGASALRRGGDLDERSTSVEEELALLAMLIVGVSLIAVVWLASTKA